MAVAVGSADAETIAALEFAFHRVFNQASGRIKLAWFLQHAARYMPPLVYAADPVWGTEAVDHHRKLIAALGRHDADGAAELTEWQFSDGAKRLTEMLEKAGIWDGI